MKNNKKYGLTLILLLLGFQGLMATSPLQPWDHTFNPALMSTGKRKYLEIGTQFNLAFANSYFALKDVFGGPEFLIDLNDIAEEIGDKDLSVAAKVDFETHFLITILGLSIGGYTNLDTIATVGIPGGLFEIMADGIAADTTYADAGEVFARSYVNLGLYAGYRWRDWQFSVKGGAYLPVAFSDGDSSFDYSFILNSNGTYSADAGVAGTAYLPFDIDDFQASGLINSLGYNLDLGAVKTRDGEPIYGFQVTGIPLYAARMPVKATFSTGFTASVTDIANYSSDNEPWEYELEDVEAEMEESDFKVYMPLSIGGFYKLKGFPRFIDWIAHGALYWDNDTLLGAAGLTAQGAISPLSALSISLGYDRVMWEAKAGLRFNIRILEMGLDVGMTSTRFIKMFSTNGLYANFYMAFGF
ncbi:MAG: hypothetical protein JXR86_08300 [Spirochaetales bacterium]|nr:hypothetical protein [Spirochaetales bacterium]